MAEKGKDTVARVFCKHVPGAMELIDEITTSMTLVDNDVFWLHEPAVQVPNIGRHDVEARAQVVVALIQHRDNGGQHVPADFSLTPEEGRGCCGSNFLDNPYPVKLFIISKEGQNR